MQRRLEVGLWGKGVPTVIGRNDSYRFLKVSQRSGISKVAGVDSLDHDACTSPI
jgi:hypothetical protein